MTTERSGMLLALDTATQRTVVAVGDASGPRAVRSSDRSGPPLLDAIEAALADSGIGPRDLAGVAVGTGPGSFTGLRVGLATAKTMAYALGIDLFGASTVEALALGVAPPGSIAAVVLAAGARDHYLARVAVARPDPAAPSAERTRLVEPVRLLPPGTDLRAAIGDDLGITVGLAHDALGPEAAQRGHGAVERLADALLAIGFARWLEARGDDVATLVPQYVALPRGVLQAAGDMAWSPDLR